MYMNNLVAQTQMKLMHSKNLILHCAPGTGKTYLARQVAAQMLGVDMSDLQNYPDRFAMLQVHPGYDYTDFVEGLRPTKDATTGEIRFELKAGIFNQFCQRVPQGDEPCVFVIDEISRGDLASIFGELFFSLDPGYREGGHPILPLVPGMLPPSAIEITTKCQPYYNFEIKESPMYFEYACSKRVHSMHRRFLLWRFNIAESWNKLQLVAS